MKRVWKWIMHLNAMAFCFAALLFFIASAGWSAYQCLTPPEPLNEGTGALPVLPEPWVIGAVRAVNDQLELDDLVEPVCPFLPTVEAILKSGVNPQDVGNAVVNARNQNVDGKGGSPKDPFANNGKGGNRGQQSAATPGTPGGPKMVTPKIAFLGFIKRSDGSSAAMFSDSSDNSTVFYEPGKEDVHGLKVLGADMTEAKVMFPDGSVGKIPIGKSVELAPEVDKRPPPPAPPAQAKK